MFELWIPITIAAAFLQNVRSALQKHLKGQLSTTGATFTRFVYAVPVAFIYVWFLNQYLDLPLPTPNGEFAIFGAIGGVAQITATALLVYLFSLRNFTVGTTYSKTETVQAAIFGVVILGDTLSTGALIAILVSLGGVMVLSVAKGATDARSLLTSWTQKSALIGLASGAAFGISAVSYRAASLSLGDGHFLIRAGFTLACVTVLQTLIMTVYMSLREPGEFSRVIKAWRVAGLVGVAGALGSMGWFTAMTIQNAAYVRALGQIELVFTFIVSAVIFKETTNRTEFGGILMVVGGIFILLLWA